MNPAISARMANLTKFRQRASELERGMIFIGSKYKNVSLANQMNYSVELISVELNCLDVGYFICN